MTRTGLAIAATAACALVAGCPGVPGECDLAAATRVAYDERGDPAYEGQALVVAGCGYGTFCHAGAATDTFRHGVPHGLDFDLRLASNGPEVGELARLEADFERVYEHRDAIWGEVSSGHMPPGDIGTAVVRGAGEYRRDGVPWDIEEALGSDEGREVLRNWLACDVPVVERTEPCMPADPFCGTVGITVPRMPCDVDDDCTARERCDLLSGRCYEPVTPTWSSIYPIVIARECATPLCHGGDSPEAELDMTTQALARTSLLGMPSQSLSCRILMPTPVRVVAGDPDGSLIIAKLEGMFSAGGDVCGERMPREEAALATPHIDAIRQWIANGALDD